jgi:hypothetical protein
VGDERPIRWHRRGLPEGHHRVDGGGLDAGGITSSRHERADCDYHAAQPQPLDPVHEPRTLAAPGSREGWRRPRTDLLYEQMFEDLSRRQLEDLTKVWEATAKAIHWRENALGAMMRALAGGCTPEHLAAVTGFDVEVVKRLLHKPRQEFNGRHPTDRNAPGQEQFYR